MPIRLTRPIHLVGLGCGGSRLARHIAERGRDHLHELHGWDGDIVEDKNVGPQLYLPKHVNRLKVDALAEQVDTWSGIPLVRHPEMIDGPRDLSGVVLVSVDSMGARWNVWEHSIHMQKRVSLMIEMRLETTRAYIYIVDPNNPRHVEQWEKYWYPDSDSTTHGLSCGAATALFPIADLAANVCVTQMLLAARSENNVVGITENDIRVSLSPLSIVCHRW